MNLKIRIRRKSEIEWLLVYILFMPFCFGFFFELIKLPSLLKYTIDFSVITILMLLCLKKCKFDKKESKKLLYLILIFFVVSFISYFINFKSLFYYIWGLRNTFRFFVFFFACILVLNEKDANKYFKIFDTLYYLNFSVIIFQYFFQGISGDRLGGIFGAQRGSNGYIILFISIVVTKSLIEYFNQKDKNFDCICKCIIALIISGLAELKIFYLLFVYIVFAAMILTKFSYKKIFIVMSSILVLYLGIEILGRLYPNSLEIISISGFLETALSKKGYTSSGDMNRLTSISISLNMFLDTWPEKLFGLGLGNCDTSSISIFNTSFFETYGYLHYTWFSMAIMFLELGTIGLVLYMLFYILVFVYACRIEKRIGSNIIWCQTTKILAPICILLVIYNSSLRTEAAYMMFFVLSLTFLNKKESINM